VDGPPADDLPPAPPSPVPPPELPDAAHAPPIASPDRPHPPVAPAPLPGVRATLGRSLDLSLAASRELRRASLYFGLLTLATVGPFVAIILAFGAVQGGFDWVAIAAAGLQPDLVPVDRTVPGWLLATGLVATVGFIVISIEAPIIGMAILTARRVGRPLTTREALRRSRQVFWQVVGASILVGFILIVPNLVIQAVLTGLFGAGSQTSAVLSSAAGAIVSAPFAYLVAGIVLGDVGPGEAVRRSTRLARLKWPLAIAVSSVSAVVAYLQLFAFGAGADILARIGTALDVGFGSGAGGTAMLVVVVMLGVLSLGSLTFTLAALIAAPQTVAFLDLTGYFAGIERARDASGDEPLRIRWLTIPMTILIGLGLASGLAGVSALL
jgi:hypothetical protein